MENCSMADEDKIPIKEVIKTVNKNLKKVIRVVDDLNLGRTEVKKDGVYRTFNDGTFIKLASGNFKRKKLNNKRIKLF